MRNLIRTYQNYILFSVSTRFIRDWIVSRYLDQILQILKEYKRDILRIEFVVQDSKKFEAQVEDLYEFMDADDTNIRFELSEEMRKFIYAWYDEETEREYEIPILKDIDFSGFTD